MCGRLDILHSYRLGVEQKEKFAFQSLAKNVEIWVIPYNWVCETFLNTSVWHHAPSYNHFLNTWLQFT